MITVAIDIGGTFTDLIGFDDKAKKFVEAKSLTTPYESGAGHHQLHRQERACDVGTIDELIHGSTTAINTLIERKGAKTALVVTRGTRDVYTIGRGNRPESYNLLFHRAPAAGAAPPDLRGGRARARLRRGHERRSIKRRRSRPLSQQLKAEGVEAVAVCFLHSYANPEHERAAGEIIRKALPNAYVSLSHEILREYREYERTSTTVVNAYIGPKVGGYVREPRSRTCSDDRLHAAICRSCGPTAA